MAALPANVHQRPDLHGKRAVFADREEAGAVLAEMLAPLGEKAPPPLLLAIPAGGVPVAAAIARRLGWPWSLWVTSKATPPWNSEVGFGAVAAGGVERVEAERVAALGLDEAQLNEGLERARRRVAARMARFLDGRLPEVAGRTVVLVDDGLATGVTMEAAVEAVRRAGARRIVVAVPTAHEDALRRLAARVDAVYCPNVRAGFVYAVAEAYRHWTDVSDQEVLESMKEMQSIQERSEA